MIKISISGILPAALILVAISVHGQQSFSVQGSLGKSIQGIIVLSYTEQNKGISDTAMIKDGTFRFRGQIQEPVYAKLTLNPAAYDPQNPVMGAQDERDFFIDPANITVQGAAGLQGAAIQGGASDKDFQQYMATLLPIRNRGNELTELHNKYKAEGNDTALAAIQQEVASLRNKRVELQEAFIKSNPNSFVAFSLWLRKTTGVIELPAIETGFNGFSERIRNSYSGKRLADRISIARTLNVGKPAIDFTLPDTEGKNVSLGSFKGKNVVLCFWYRSFIPFETFAFKMAQINKQLKGEDLEIVCVFYTSENFPRQGWLQILKENNLEGCTNLIDENGIDPVKGAVSPTARAYDLEYSRIPQCYLVGKDGKVLARDINLATNPVSQIKTLLNK